MHGFPPYDTNSMVVRPLTEIPTLRVADPTRDVRGWEVQDEDGRLVGTVTDLLVDVDRLSADTLLVSLAAGDHAGNMVAVALHRLSPEHGSHRRLVAREGMQPIPIQYQSTTHYALWVATAVAIGALAGWVLGFFG